MNNRYDIVIAGGGASGLFAAAVASEQRSVCILERGERCGRKLCATGNGWGNLCNRNLSADKFHSRSGADFSFVQALHLEILSRFEAMGLLFYTAENGRIYPRSKQASAITDLLRERCAQNGVTEVCEAGVTQIRPCADGFEVFTPKGVFSAKKVLICCGGKAAPHFGTDGTAYGLLQAFGHTLTPLAPSLVQLKTETQHTKTLKGVKCDAALTVYEDGHPAACTEQELLFTEYGISGPAAFDVSGPVSEALSLGKTVTVSVDFLPDIERTQLTKYLLAQAQRLHRSSTEHLLSGVLPKQIPRMLLRMLHLDGMCCGTLSEGQLTELAKQLKGFTLPVRGTLGFAQAQVTKGGISAAEFDEHFMSRKQAGLYACGEILDMDGDCGGYNLMLAWCSAYLAAKHASESVLNA